MIDVDAIPALIVRLSNATGPDQALDAAIFRAIGAPVPFQFATALVALTYDEMDECYYAPIGGMRIRYTPPTYTGSMDAALTLVPPLYDWIMGHTNGGLTIYASVGDQYDMFGNTPPLAMCAASLRAHLKAAA